MTRLSNDYLSPPFFPHPQTRTHRATRDWRVMARLLKKNRCGRTPPRATRTVRVLLSAHRPTRRRSATGLGGPRWSLHLAAFFKSGPWKATKSGPWKATKSGPWKATREPRLAFAHTHPPHGGVDHGPSRRKRVARRMPAALRLAARRCRARQSPPGPPP